MLVTLIPLFDETMTVRAYSLFTQKKNFLLNPSLLGSGQNDGAPHIDGLEIIENMGIETLCSAREIFVPLTNISIFSDIAAQCNAPHERLVLLIDCTIPPVEMYLKRLRELKALGYKLAIRKLPVQRYEDYRHILALMDYILLDCEKIDLSKAKIFFGHHFPHLSLCASNIKSNEIFGKLKKDNCCELYEGSFFRIAITKGDHEVAPLKVNYIELMNLVNSADFDLTEAADIIARDTALVISLLQMVNHMAINSEITSIRHAAAMLGQKELKRWVSTAVVKQLCSDKPNEITRLSLLRAKFAENLAPVFDMAFQSSELFLMGLFSVLDIILEKPMAEALELVKVSQEIRDALISDKGSFAKILNFMLQYETAEWPEVSRLMIIHDISMPDVYDAYIKSLKWYKDLVTGI